MPWLIAFKEVFQHCETSQQRPQLYHFSPNPHTSAAPTALQSPRVIRLLSNYTDLRFLSRGTSPSIPFYVHPNNPPHSSINHFTIAIFQLNSICSICLLCHSFASAPCAFFARPPIVQVIFTSFLLVRERVRDQLNSVALPIVPIEGGGRKKGIILRADSALGRLWAVPTFVQRLHRRSVLQSKIALARVAKGQPARHN